MKLLLTSVLLSVCISVNGQTLESKELLKEHLTRETESSGGGIQVNQFLDNCIYDHKCGVFLGGSIRTFGVIKGFMLTIDRRLRCTQLARSQFLPVRVNEQGLIKDHWNNYSIETK